MLAIFARVLMLVACVPLLQPTGYCVCKAGEWRGTSLHRESVAATSHSPATAPKGGCCSQRHTADDADQSVSSPATPAPPPCPLPDDDRHLPGCPASAGVDRFKWVEPAQSVAQTLPPVEVGTALPLESLVPAASRPVPPAAPWPSSPPIYLTHCSLVI